MCALCGERSFWVSSKLVYPDVGYGEPPNPDLPEEIREDYEEAAEILRKSPRGAAALLRLALQKLCEYLGEPGKNINDDIASLVKKGLPAKVQEALDYVRVVGNNAVHPGTIDLKDDVDTASNLFKLLNIIANKMISEPKQLDQLYMKLPKPSRDAIAARDEKKP